MENTYRLKITRSLGKGVQGEAFRTSEGSVLKVTRSVQEIIICAKLCRLQRLGFDFWNMPVIMAVAQMSACRYAILREDVPDAPTGNDPSDALIRFGSAWHTDRDEDIGEAIAEEPGLLGLYRDLVSFREMTDISLFDISSPGNVGAGHVLRDLGAGRGICGADLQDIAWSHLRISYSMEHTPTEYIFRPMEDMRASA